MRYDDTTVEGSVGLQGSIKPNHEPTSGAPLLMALDGVTSNISELDQVIDTAFKKLDHLILHAPEAEDRDTIALARQAHSDTVTRVETLAERIQDSKSRLLRLIRLIEA